MNIKLSSTQIDILCGHDLKEESKEKGLTASNIYNANNLKIADIKALVAEEKQLVSRLKKTIYNANFLIFSALNPDHKVFEYVYNLYIENKIDISKINRVKGYRKKDINGKSFFLLENDNLMSIAYKIKNEELIAFLQKNSLSELSLSNIPYDFSYHYYSDSFNNKVDFLRYSVFVALQNVQHKWIERPFFKDEINRYVSVALLNNTLEEYIAQYKQEKSFIDKLEEEKGDLTLMCFYLLSFADNIFKNECYRKEVFPMIFKQALMVEHGAGSYAKRESKYIFEDYEEILMNFCAEAATNEIVYLIDLFDSTIDKNRIDQDKRIKIISRLKIYKEKKELQNIIIEDKTNKRLNKI